MPVLPEGDNDTITDNDRTRRVRGRELADLLCGECFICSLTRSVCIMNVRYVWYLSGRSFFVIVARAAGSCCEIKV